MEGAPLPPGETGLPIPGETLTLLTVRRRAELS
jgi:hypothetical protein